MITPTMSPISSSGLETITSVRIASRATSSTPAPVIAPASLSSPLARARIHISPIPQVLSCEGARHTVPSPLVGEGQGEGWRQIAEPEASSFRRPNDDGWVYLLEPQYKTNAVRVIPLSLS